MTLFPADNRYYRAVTNWHGRKQPFREDHRDLHDRVTKLMRRADSTEAEWRALYLEIEGLGRERPPGPGRREEYVEAFGAVQVLRTLRDAEGRPLGWKEMHRRCRDLGIHVQDEAETFKRCMLGKLRRKKIGN